MFTEINKFEKEEATLLSLLKTAGKIEESKAFYYDIETAVEEKARDLISSESKAMMRLTLESDAGKPTVTYIADTAKIPPDDMQRMLQKFEWYFTQQGLILLKSHQSKLNSFKQKVPAVYEHLSFTGFECRGDNYD